MNPTCKHPECHDTRTRGYMRVWMTGNTSSNMGEPNGVEIDFTGQVGKRLCRIHALQELKVA